MAAEYQTFTFVWCDRQVDVAHQAHWLTGCPWHIELRCKDRLPLTKTGYRSIFVPSMSFASDAAVQEFVTELLDQAATDKAWLRYLEDSRQLKLF